MKNDEKVIKAIGYMQSKQNTINLLSNYYHNNLYDDYFLSNISIKKLIWHIFKKISNKRGKKTDYNGMIASIINYVENKKAIIVFAPFFDEKKDGFIRRIEYIDSTLLNEYIKIYVNCTGPAKEIFNVSFIDSNHIYVTYNCFDKEQLKCVLSLIKSVKKTYTHSINMFMLDDVNYELLQIFDDEEMNNILDVHGAVPEETQENYDDERYIVAEFVEEFIFTRCKSIVCVTNSMKNYYTKKYNLKNIKVVPLNCVYSGISLEEIKNKTTHSKPTVIYAGGLQSWQNIELMNEIIAKTVDDYNYEIYVTDVDKYRKTIDGDTLSKIKVENLLQEELEERYKNADFGFALRDKSVINEVAFPTKLIEYIKFGIIPIYKCDDIGDYSKYEHIKYEDFFNKSYKIDIKKAIKHNYKMYEEQHKATNTINI